MPSYYLQNTFFNTYHRFEGGEGKRLRDSLAEKFSFMVALGSDDLGNVAKRDAKTWSDGDMARADATVVIRDNFANTVGAVMFAGRSREAPSTYAIFTEKHAETFHKVTSLFTTGDEPVKAEAAE